VDREVRPGDIVETVITYGAPHHLVADGEVLTHRRTRAGDNVEAGLRPKTDGVSLGLPSFGAPAALPVTSGCEA
jgi:tRNA-2-methylthio-N6-dimethylallyladenosine synthase